MLRLTTDDLWDDQAMRPVAVHPAPAPRRVPPTRDPPEVRRLHGPRTRPDAPRRVATAIADAVQRCSIMTATATAGVYGFRS